jgi:hypothetical protein
VCFGVDDELGSGVERFDVLRKWQKKTIFRHNQMLSVHMLFHMSCFVLSLSGLVTREGNAQTRLDIS